MKGFQMLIAGCQSVPVLKFTFSTKPEKSPRTMIDFPKNKACPHRPQQFPNMHTPDLPPTPLPTPLHGHYWLYHGRSLVGEWRWSMSPATHSIIHFFSNDRCTPCSSIMVLPGHCRGREGLLSWTDSLCTLDVSTVLL